jgi:hypothetical protein
MRAERPLALFWRLRDASAPGVAPEAPLTGELPAINRATDEQRYPERVQSSERLELW